MLETANKPKNRDQTLDIFRAVAVLFVVLFHYTARLPLQVFGASESILPEFSFGWVGVYFFFILSGFCIFFTLERAPTVWTFFAKRISRIYPAFVAAALLLFAVDQVFPLPILPEYSYRDALPRFIDLVGNLFLMGGVFEWVNGSFWSITVEIQFYLLIGAMAMFIKQGARLARVFSYLSIVMGLLWLVVMFGSMQIDVLGKVALALKKGLIAPYLPFFALGVVGVQLKARATNSGILFVVLTVLSVAIVMVMSADEVDAFLTLQSLSTGLIVLGLVGIFSAYCVGWRLPHIPLFSNGMGHIGLLSYSWYLLHENLGFLLLDALNPALPYWASVVVTMLATYAAAVVFSKLFEWRFRAIVERMVGAALGVVAKLLPQKISEGLA